MSPSSEAQMRHSPPYRTLGKPLSVLRDVRARMRRTWLVLRSRGRATIGRNVRLGTGLAILSPDFFRVGDDVWIGNEFHAGTNVEIGSDVLISKRVAFVGNDHPYDLGGVSVYWSGRAPAATVRIGSDCLIGYGAIIVGNVSIGDGCIIGAGSVVTSDLPPETICAGVPARPLAPRRRSVPGGTEDQKDHNQVIGHTAS